MIARETIEAVKNLDISETIERLGVELKRAGTGTLKGLCPFHDERSPSFTVRPNNGSYKCFGCGEGGDIIKFVQELEGLSFTESVKMLTEMYGINFVETGVREEKTVNKTRLKTLLNVAASFYEDEFNKLPVDHPAKQELNKRNLLQYSDVFQIGYAPQGWSNLYNFLKDNGYNEEEVILSGLVNKSDNGRLYDVFRGRVLWQIKDIIGSTIGFGGRRIFDEDTAKYINSPQSPLYDKSKVLFGLNLARAEAVKKKQLIVVEGYTDVMAYHAAGVVNVVAVCGTAFGSGHLNLVKRFLGDDGEIVFSFDGDKAGTKAAVKVFELLRNQHSNIYATSSKEGDPDELRIKYGDKGIHKLVEAKKPITEFVLLTTLEEYDITIPEQKHEYIKKVGPLLDMVNPIYVNDYIRKVSVWIGVLPQNIIANGNIKPRKQNSNIQVVNEPVLAENPNPIMEQKQETLLALLVQYPKVVWLMKGLLPKVEEYAVKYQPIAGYLYGLAAKGLNLIENINIGTCEHPQQVAWLLHKEFPLISKSSSDINTERAVYRLTKTITRNLDEATQKQSIEQYLNHINQIYAGTDSTDIDILKEIDNKIQQLKKQ